MKLGKTLGTLIWLHLGGNRLRFRWKKKEKEEENTLKKKKNLKKIVVRAAPASHELIRPERPDPGPIVAAIRWPEATPKIKK